MTNKLRNEKKSHINESNPNPKAELKSVPHAPDRTVGNE